MGLGEQAGMYRVQMASTLLPAAPINANSFATLAPRRSTERISPPRRPGTSQLTLHEYRKLQESPLLSSSPELRSRRVRRVAATSNLAAGSSMQTALAGAGVSRSVSPTFIHSLARHDFLPSLHPPPPPPSTPQQRPPSTSSPSLSSTVETLQSTPTHTPVPRESNHLNHHHHHLLQQVQLSEPVRTKRKFATLRPAKRLPRPANSSGGSSSSSSAGELYSVYAAVFDPSGGDSLTDPIRLTEQDYPPTHNFGAAESGGSVSEQYRQTTSKVRIGKPIEPRPANLTDTAGDSSAHQERDLAASSSISLSRFEFPVPPGQDNWGTVDHIEDLSSPTSPATLHYYGTSFDVVNPHASLLLGTHNFETPAEIDGLLDDYFQQESDANQDNMANQQLRTEISQQSLATASDASRHARVLYQDTNSARRNILHVDDNLPTPSAVFINDSPLASKSSSNVNIPQAFANPSAQLVTSRKPDHDSGIDPADSVIKSTKGEVEHDESSALSKESIPDVKPVTLNQSSSSLTKKVLEIKRSLSRKSKKERYLSDPFDLTLSDTGEDIPVPSIVGLQKQRIECESTPEGQDDDAPSPLPEQGYTTHANVDDHNTDPIVREILSGYDYTREQPGRDDHDVFIHSPSLEKCTFPDEQRYDSAQRPVKSFRPISPNPFADDTFPAEGKVSPGTLCFPTPPAPVYSGARHLYFEGCSDLPTSEQTYGETNQLLLVTPEAVNGGSKITSKVVYHDCPSDNAPARQTSNHHYHDDKEFTPPSPSVERARAYTDDVAPTPSARKSTPGYDCFSLSPGDWRRQLRISSIYTDNESAWETQYTGSPVDLAQEHERTNDENYANTSNFNGNNRPLGMVPKSFSISSVGAMKQQELLASSHPPAEAVNLVYASKAGEVAQPITTLLEDGIHDEELQRRVCGGPAPDKEQRRRDHAELELFRKENPSGFNIIAEGDYRKARNRTSFPSSESLSKLQSAFNMGKDKDSESPKQNFNKAIAFGYGTKGHGDDPVSDRRRLLDPTPSPGPKEGELQWSDSFGSMVTLRGVSPFVSRKQMYGDVPDFWSPFMGDMTSRVLDSRNLESPYHPANSSVIRPATNQPRGTRAAITSQKELHSLTLKPPKPSWSPRAAFNLDERTQESHEMQTLKPPKPCHLPFRNECLSNEALIECSARWKMEPNLTAEGALGKWASQPEQSAKGPVLPRLGKLAREDGHIDLNDPLRDGGKEARSVAALSCLVCPLWLGLRIIVGGGDSVIRKKTRGLHTMNRNGYWHCVGATVVGLMIYAGIVAGLWAVVKASRKGDGNGGGDSTPFADHSRLMPH